MKSELVPGILHLMGSIIAGKPATSCAAFLSPAFVYKGNLFAEEYALLRTLSSAGVSVDASFQLLFDPKSKSDTWAKQLYSFVSYGILHSYMWSFPYIHKFTVIIYTYYIYISRAVLHIETCQNNCVLLLLSPSKFLLGASGIRMQGISAQWHTRGDSLAHCNPVWMLQRSSGCGRIRHWIDCDEPWERPSRPQQSSWFKWRTSRPLPYQLQLLVCMVRRSMRKSVEMQRRNSWCHLWKLEFK